MNKWNIKIVGNTFDAVKYLKALTAAFEVAATLDEPLHHVYMSDPDSSLECEEQI